MKKGKVMKDYEEVKISFLNRSDMQVLRRTCHALGDIRHVLNTLVKNLQDEAIAVAAEEWRLENHPDEKMDSRLLRSGSESIARHIVDSGDDDLGAITVGFWVDEEDYSVNSIAACIESYPGAILGAYNDLFKEKDEQKENAPNEVPEDPNEQSFMEAVLDYDEDENYAARCILMEEAFVRDACNMIALANCCCDRASEYDLFILDENRFESEYLRVWSAVINKATMSADDCISILKALKRDIPLEGSIKKEAVAALEEWRNPYEYKADFLSYVYKKLGDCTR